MTRKLKAEGAVAWVFQAGPGRWRITDYLADARRDTQLRDTTWLVRPPAYGELMRAEQPVFVWRAAGEHKPDLPVGVVAVGRINGHPAVQPDDKPMYRGDSGDPRLRLWCTAISTSRWASSASLVSAIRTR